MQDADITDGNAFADKVKVDLDMLCTLVLNNIGGEVDSTDVITVDKSALEQKSMELLEELPEATSFSHVVGYYAILSLNAQSGDDVLALEGPGDEVITDEHSVARGKSACIWATRLVRICVDR
jgi:hypothetical protein